MPEKEQPIITSNRIGNRLFYPIILFFALYFGFWWLISLGSLPGLHGDEAWSALMAMDYRYGLDRFTGMNNYTGILQAYSIYAIFDHLKPGVFELRLPGILFNFCGLLIIYKTLSQQSRIQILIFLGIIAQCTLYLLSPRIAWEVNTFTLFFLSIVMYSSLKIIRGCKNVSLHIAIFFIANIIGTYNHIIFSSISVSIFIGILFWSIFTKSEIFGRMIVVQCVNLLNLSGLFFVMKYQMGTSSGTKFLIICSGFLICVIIEIILLSNYHITKINLKTNKLILGAVIKGLIVISVILFLIFHGLGVFDTLTNYKLLINVYSYLPNLLVQILFVSIGVMFFAYIFYNLILDLTGAKGAESLPAFILFGYLGTFSIYTTLNSFRYYLILVVLFAMYASYKIALISSKRIFYVVLCSSFFLVNFCLVKIYLIKGRRINAIELKVGNNKIENSGHFLPKEPLIRFLKQQHTKNIYYVPERYFIEKPVLFYQRLTPWKVDSLSEVTIDYSGFGNSGGFIMIKK